VGVLLLSRTRLYTATGIIALGLTIFLSKRGGRKYLTIVLLTLITIALAMTFNQILAFLELRGFDTGLTGRTLTWQRTRAIMENGPQALGFGFRTFETSNFDYIFTGNYRPDHAHNSFLQAYFETGRVGQIMIIGLAIVQFFTSWRSSIENNQYSYSLFLVIYVILGSLFGLNYAGALSTIFCLMLLFFAIETRKPKISKTMP
jgi:O-antigen ligase